MLNPNYLRPSPRITFYHIDFLQLWKLKEGATASNSISDEKKICIVNEHVRAWVPAIEVDFWAYEQIDFRILFVSLVNYQGLLRRSIQTFHKFDLPVSF